jgi:hypothetical protein
MKPLCLAAFSSIALVASAPALGESRSIPLGAFSEIVLTASANVEVQTGSPVSVVAIGDTNDLNRLDIRVEGERLIIGTKQGSMDWSSRKDVTVRVAMPAIGAATLSGSGDIVVDRVKGSFSGRISGSGDLALPSIDSTALALAISGSGDLTAAGRCGTCSIAISGSGDIDAAMLTCETLTASVSGSGDIRVRATGTAALRSSGSGSISVTGGARCTSKSTGSSSISCS